MDSRHWLFNEVYKYYGQNNLPTKIEFGPTGEPIFRVGGSKAKSGHEFKTLREFLDFKEKMGLRRVDVFNVTDPVDKMPSIGPSHYAGIEQTLKKLREAGLTDYHTVERWSVDTAKYESVLKEMIRGGTHYGLPVPDDEKTQILRFFDKKGKEISSSRILSDLEKTGQNIGSLRGVTSKGYTKSLSDLLPKLSKRMKDLMNIQEFSTNGWANAHKVVAFDADVVGPKLPWLQSQLKRAGGLPEDELAKFYSRSVEGLSILNPALADKMGNELVSRAGELRKGLLKELASTTDPQVKLAIQNKLTDTEKLLKTAEDMKRVARKGGRLEGVRIREFLMSDASKELGLSESQMRRLEQGMIKGDVLVPSDWSKTVQQMNQILTKAIPGFKGFDDTVAGLFAMQNITQELGGKAVGKGGLISAKINHAVPIVRADIQSLAAYGKTLYNPDMIERANKEFFDLEFNTIKNTGAISPRYRRALEETAKLETSRMTALQKQNVMRDLGTKDILELENRIVRAKRILGRINAGVPIFEDKTLLREITDSLIDSVRADARHAGEPRFMMPGAYRAHITTMTQAKLGGLMGEKEVLEPGTSIFRNGSIIFSDLDMNELYRAHGGWDLDDLLAQHLRYFEGSDTRKAGFYAINFRSPGGLGELSTMRMDVERSSDDLFEIMARSNSRVRETLDGIVIPANKSMAQREVDFATATRIRSGIRNTIGKIEKEKADLEAKKVVATGRSKSRIEKKIDRKTAALDKLIHTDNYIESQVKQRTRQILDNPSTYFDTVDEDALALAERTAKAAKTGDLGSITNNWAKYWSADADAIKKADIARRFSADSEIMREGDRLQEMMSRWESSSIDDDDLKAVRSMIDDAADSTTVSRFLYNDMVEKGLSPGILGRYSNVKMMSDATIGMLMDMEERGMAVPAHLKGIFRPTEMENIIDLIVQGAAEGSDIQLKDVGQRAMSMVDALAQTAAAGVKLDPLLFQTRMKPYEEAFKFALQDINPDMAFEDVFLDMSKADEAELAYSSRMYKLGQDIEGYAETGQRRLLREAMPTRKEIMATVFDPTEYDEADLMAKHMDDAQMEWDNLRAGLEVSVRDSELIGDVPDEDFWDNLHSKFMRQKFQDNFTSYFEESDKKIVSLERGVTHDRYMGEKAENIFGAFLQRHGSKWGYLADSGDMGKHRSEIEQRLVDRAQGRAVPRRTLWGSDFRTALEAPGLGKQAMAEGDAALTDAIIKPIGKAGDLGNLMRGLGRIPSIKKGLIGAGLLVAGSMLYQTVKQDVPQEELEGMPNMPGGNFYTGDSTIPPQGPPQIASAVPTNGVTYRVNASGNYDPAALSRVVEEATGAPASGQVYNRPRYDPYRESRIINESF